MATILPVLIVKVHKRTPGRPRAIFGLARSAQLLGDNQTAAAEYKDFLKVWKNAD
jgi:hypothetical protein